MSVAHRRIENGASLGVLGVLLALAMLIASVVVVAILFTQSATTTAPAYVWDAIGGLLLVLVVVAALVVMLPGKASVTAIDFQDGGRVQHRDTSGRFAAGSMGTLKTGEEGGTAVPEGVGSSAPGGLSSPGDKNPAV